MLGSRKGLRDINKGVSDIRSSTREIKMASASPEKKVGLLTDERDARLKEAENARSKAYGFGAKRFIEQAEMAEYKAEKARYQIEEIMAAHPDIQPVRSRGFAERVEDLSNADARTRRLYKEGAFTKEQLKEQLKQNKADSKRKTVVVELESEVSPPKRSIGARLQELKQLHEQGWLTDDGFELKRVKMVEEL